MRGHISGRDLWNGYNRTTNSPAPREASTFICRSEALASEMTIGLLQTRSTSFATSLRAENSILLNHVKKWSPSNDRVSRLESAVRTAPKDLIRLRAMSALAPPKYRGPR